MAPRKNNLRNENDSVEEIEEEDDEEESIEMPPSLLRKVVVLQKLHADTEDIDVEYKKARFITSSHHPHTLENLNKKVVFNANIIDFINLIGENNLGEEVSFA
jgi:hypothetical protein